MKYNPKIHNRRSIRLEGYDYRRAGLYFVTICCQDRICRFGHVENGEMILNKNGQIACNEWMKLSERFPNITFDAFQIMPNHMHGIISIVRAGPAPAQKHNTTQDHTGEPRGIAPTVGDIVGTYKSLVANGCLKIYKSKNEIMGKLWQRNYWEHIIRNEQSYHRISNYIIENPRKWVQDNFFEQ